MEESTNSAQVTGQKPPTKVFIIQVGQTRSYYISVEAESAEQAQKAWEQTGFEYSARYQPEYEWDDEESLFDVSDSDDPVENAEVDYNEVRSALGLKSLEE